MQHALIILSMFVMLVNSKAEGFDLYIGNERGTELIAGNTSGISAMSSNGTLAFVSEDSLLTRHQSTTTLIASIGDLSIVGALSVGPFGVNNRGTAVFRGILSGGGFGLFIGNGKTVTKIADNTSGMFVGVGEAAINNTGAIAFTAMPVGGNRAIFVGPPPFVKVIGVGDTILGFTVMSLGVVNLNDSGQISFVANNPGGSEGTVIRATRGPSGYSFEKIADDAATPSINNSGKVSFLSYVSDSAVGVSVGDGDSVMPIATIADTFEGHKYTAFGSTPTINERGDVVFWASLEDGGIGIFLGDGAIIVKIADNTGGPCTDYGTFTGISNSDTVAFHCHPQE